MAKVICQAVKNKSVDRKGKSSIEWYKDGVPQKYCYGYVDGRNDEPIEECAICPIHVDKAQEDLESWQNQKKAQSNKKVCLHCKHWGYNNGRVINCRFTSVCFKHGYRMRFDEHCAQFE